MEEIAINGIRIIFEANERETAGIIGQVCEKIPQIIRREWGLEIPKDCRVIVMTSLFQFMLHSTPWQYMLPLALTFPLWYFRFTRIWKFAGGWALRYGNRGVVGVKPSWLVKLADRSIGEKIFVKEDNDEGKVQSIACHELTHACTAHLKLPMWLNEGLAMVTVDKFLGKTTIMENTLQAFQSSRNQQSPGNYRRVSTRDKEALVYRYVRGYWITRYVLDTRPDLLRNLLNQRQPHKVLEDKIASSYGMARKEFWKAIDGILVFYFMTTQQSSNS